ncbi:MAG: ammonia monooxygenase [Propionibacteriales bacterium]|nr:ammonia monooxygenase [Propionibacteriales bacterium]
MNRRAVSDAALLLAGGTVGAAALTLAKVPAGTLVGAVVGSAVANRLSARRSELPAEVAQRSLPTPVRVVGMVLLGCVAGVRLDRGTLHNLAEVALPLGIGVLLLLAVNVLVAAVLVRRYGIDPLTAVLACAPGGVSEIAVTASQLGARTGVVLSVHMVRVLAVVLVVLPLLVAVLGRP